MWRSWHLLWRQCDSALRRVAGMVRQLPRSQYPSNSRVIPRKTRRLTGICRHRAAEQQDSDTVTHGSRNKISGGAGGWLVLKFTPLDETGVPSGWAGRAERVPSNPIRLVPAWEVSQKPICLLSRGKSAFSAPGRRRRPSRAGWLTGLLVSSIPARERTTLMARTAPAASFESL